MQPQEERQTTSRKVRRPTPLNLDENALMASGDELTFSPSNALFNNIRYGPNTPFSPALTWLAPSGQLFFSPNAVRSTGSNGSDGFWSNNLQEGDEERVMKAQNPKHNAPTPMALFQYHNSNQYGNNPMARPGMEWQEGKSTTNDSEFDLLKEVINSPRSPTNSRQVNNQTYRASQEPWVEENDPEYLTVKCVDNNKRPLVQNHVVYDNTVKRRRTDNFGGQTISPNSPSLMYNQDTMKHFATYPPTGPFILSPVNYLQNQGHFFQPGLSPQQHHHQQQNNSNASSIINPNLKLRTDGKVKDPGIKWTPEQDEQLKKAVEKYKESNWKSIAKMVDGRNHVQCLQRWKKVLQPGLIKGMWSEEEDNLLLRLMRQYNGDKCWTKIAESIPGRTAKQCRERFYLNLDPTINREPWTRQEDELLVDLHRRLGNKWAEIKRNLPGRTENGVKSRFKSIQRALKKQQAMKK